MKQRFKKLNPKLELASDQELFTELMKRVYKKQPAICYFVDKISFSGEYDIHTAASMPILMTKGVV